MGSITTLFVLGTFVALAVFPQLKPAAKAMSVTITAQPAPEWQHLLRNAHGWIGSDCACSVPLGRDRVLWLFDDTFVGEVRDGKRLTQGPMIRNTLGLQTGSRASNAKIQFIFGKSSDGGAAAFLVPPDGRGWFWFGGGVVAGQHLWLTLWQMESTGQHSAFGFRTSGSWLASVANYRDPPEQWKVAYERLPFLGSRESTEFQFGNALTKAGRWVYVYGLQEITGSSPPRRGLIVARAPAGRLGDLTSWRFLTDSGWSEDWRRSAPSGTDLGSEFSVSYVPAIRRYALVYSPSTLAPEIRVSTSPSPSGSWSVSKAVYTCPEGSKPAVFCYAARAHPELSQSKTLLATYASNSFSFANLIDDSSLYFPVFVTIKFTRNP